MKMKQRIRKSKKKAKRETQRGVPEDEGGIDEKRNQNEGENVKKKMKRNIKSLYASMSLRRFLNRERPRFLCAIEC